jgi:hypothetical protein
MSRDAFTMAGVWRYQARDAGIARFAARATGTRADAAVKSFDSCPPLPEKERMGAVPVTLTRPGGIHDLSRQPEPERRALPRRVGGRLVLVRGDQAAARRGDAKPGPI